MSNDPVRDYLLRRHKQAVDERNEMSRRLQELKQFKGQMDRAMLLGMATTLREKLKAYTVIVQHLRDELEDIKGF